MSDFDCGIAVGDAANDRGKIALAIRQHIFIAGELRPGKLDAVEHIVIRVGLPDAQAAT